MRCPDYLEKTPLRADGGKFPSNSIRPVQTTRRPSESEEYVEYIDDCGPLRSSRSNAMGLVEVHLID